MSTNHLHLARPNLDIEPSRGRHKQCPWAEGEEVQSRAEHICRLHLVAYTTRTGNQPKRPNSALHLRSVVGRAMLGWAGLGWAGLRCIRMGQRGMGQCGMGRCGMGRSGMGRCGMGWCGMVWDGMEWDGMGCEGVLYRYRMDCDLQASYRLSSRSREMTRLATHTHTPRQSTPPSATAFAHTAVKFVQRRLVCGRSTRVHPIWAT